MTDALIVLTTYPDQETALKAASKLVREKLAACVNVLPQMTSVYEWRGEAKTDREHLLIAKTTLRRFAALETAIVDTHPYELPEIIATPIAQGLKDYLKWIDAQTTP
ncbi:MAG TPA: divalent-cation tolerance protein CutA [Gammaproteobacteria bacterium]|jgi:periplasmic divalent cation tolerance protein|nr:divalent-cation tolerance protein CutA [Pseudomonadota bacterium]MDQ4147616.1 divalent-cation tolerance protein CutA [Pseudomonadota bacterium]HEX2239152.1 divalent-cation tolerance protein CutA [Gammaproteobacteria bacterium]HEX2241899.1 divalent-cation tolerance protein CutA [Gammaproteobacteria bacterium]